MIIYYTGTGNSRFAAGYISKCLQKLNNGRGETVTGEMAAGGTAADKRVTDQRAADQVTTDLFTRIRDKDHTPMHSDSPWIVVMPTYAWRIPRILEDWLKNTELKGSRDIYFVMTCGDGIGNAGQYAARLCREKSMRYMGCLEVVMPENYIAMFKTPDRNRALEIIKAAEPVLEGAARAISLGKPFEEKKINPLDRFLSGPVNDIFYPAFVHAGKFRVTDKCISCGKCVSVCPLKNIRLKNNRPLWGENCTHCMACISYCPTEAIEYGRHSVGLPRYTFPEDMIKMK